jgi:phosphatidylglycerophosphate synthase
VNSSHHKKAWYVINGITIYRIVAAPFLLVLLFTKNYELFKWLLGLSFFTDLIDGFLARKYKVTSIMGTKLDSIGDDLTVLVGVTGLFVMYPAFIKEQKIILIIMLALFIIQVSYALARYGKMTNFHTWLAKAAALLQGVFLLVTFFMDQPHYVLFYAAAFITSLELIEETIMVGLLPEWKDNVKGIFEILKRKKKKT